MAQRNKRKYRAVVLAAILTLVSVGSIVARTLSSVPTQNVITTIAGTGVFGYTGDGGAATSAQLGFPTAVAADGFGNIYIADSANQVIRQVFPNGSITSIAGYFGAADIAVDGVGNLFIADPMDSVVLELTATDIFVVAGNLTSGYSGDGGPATSASLVTPTGVALDNAGNLYIADSGNNRVRMVNTSGVISTVAGTDYSSFFPSFKGDGGPAIAARLNNPSRIAVSPSGDLYVADQGNNRIRKVDSSGTISTAVGNGTTSGSTNDGLPATSSSIPAPSALAFDAAGTLYFADSTYRIRRIAADGTLQTVAGGGSAGIGDGPATSATLSTTEGLAFDLDGNLLFADFAYSRIRKVSALNSSASSPLRAIHPSSVLRGSTEFGWIAGTNLSSATAVTFSGTGVGTAILAGGTANWLPIAIAAAPDAPLGPRTVTVTTPSGVLGPIGGFSVVAGNSIRIDSISTLSAGQNTTLQMSLSGTGFANATNVAFSGAGVTATISAGATDNYLPLSITIAANATAGLRTITVSTPMGSSDPFNGFTVIQPRLNPINTVAGNGIQNSTGDGGQATMASVSAPQGIAVDPAGNLFITDYNRIRKVSPSGIITTVAGTGVSGFSGDGGPATSALLNAPGDVVVDGSGNLYIADSGNYRVRKVTADGTIHTVAGSGNTGPFPTPYGDGGPALLAELVAPSGLALDSSNNLYIADGNTGRVRMVTPAGAISTVAGGATVAEVDGEPATSAKIDGMKIALDQSGNLFIGGSKVWKVNSAGIITTVAGDGTFDYGGDGGPATLAQFSGIRGLAVDAAGNVFIADNYSNRIRMIDSNGIVTTIAGNGVKGFSGDHGPAISAELAQPGGLALDGAGNLFISDTGNNRVRRIPARTPDALPAITGISPFFADRGTSVNATISGTGLGGVTSVTLSGTGATAVIAGAVNDTSVPVTINVSADAVPGPRLVTVATNAASYSFNSFMVRDPIRYPLIGVMTPATATAGMTIPVTVSGVNLTGATAVNFSGNGIAAVLGTGGTDSTLTLTLTVAPDAAPGPRNVTVTTPAATSPAFLFNVDAPGPAGVVTTLAGYGGPLFLAGNNPPLTSGPILFAPTKAVMDASGNLIILETNNHRIRKLTPSGVWSIFAGMGTPGSIGDNGPATSAQLWSPADLALDRFGNVFIADSGNNRIRKVDTNGIITTVAGPGSSGVLGDNGPATSASLINPDGVAVDTNGNLFIADRLNFRIRKVSTAGTITTIAGNGTSLLSGDGGPATSAGLGYPLGLAVDGSGNVFFVDSNRIRKVTAGGVINTVAGNGGYGFSGDGGPATSAQFYYPQGVAVDQSGDLFIADTDNSRIREVTPDGVITTVAGSGPLSVAAYGGDGGPATSRCYTNPWVYGWIQPGTFCSPIH
jgi:sugar lactone lactonase YvrE